jgi:hypothetical protein
MSLSPAQIAQVRLSRAREDANGLGAEARLKCAVYLLARGKWLAALDKIIVFENDVNEQVALEVATQKRKARNHGEEDNQAIG